MHPRGDTSDALKKVAKKMCLHNRRRRNNAVADAVSSCGRDTILSKKLPLLTETPQDKLVRGFHALV